MTFWAFADAHPSLIGSLAVLAVWTLVETAETIAGAVRGRRK